MLAVTHRTTIRALLGALVLALALPVAALSADQLVTKADSTFRLLPGQERIKVAVDISMTNRAAPTYVVKACSPGSSQRCRFKQTYWYESYRYVWIPAGATNIKFSKGVSPSLAKQARNWKQYEVRFPNLYYNQTRKFKVNYDLPGGEPRSKHRTRVMDAYTYFCWHGEPADSGKVVAKLPVGYEATTFYEQTKVKSTRDDTIITGKFKGNPGKFYACTDASKPAKLVTTEVTAPGGQRVTIEAWPEDPEWSEAIVDTVENSLPELEALIGRPLPFDEVVVREVSKQSLYGYGTQFGVRHSLTRIGEHVDDPASALVSLSGAWFNHRKIEPIWLRMGLSEWAGNEVGAWGCWPPGEYPGKGEPKLRTWRHLSEKATEREEDVHSWQYRAACDVVTDIADRIGEERMHAVIASLLDGTPKYGPQEDLKPPGKHKPATWKDWLDAADEIGLVPAGETDLAFAEAALKDVGIATAKQLRGRAKARTAYHETLATMEGTAMPGFVDRAMGKWDFKSATKALPAVAAAYEAITTNEQMAEADRESFLSRLEKAKSPKALRSLKRQATGFESTEPADEEVPTIEEPAEPEVPTTEEPAEPEVPTTEEEPAEPGDETPASA